MPLDPSAELGFLRNGLARAGIETEADRILQDSSGPEGLTVAVAGDQVILHANGGAVATALLSGFATEARPLERVVLGRRDGRAVSAVLFGPEDAARFTADPAFTAHDLRSIAVQGLVPPDELGALAQGKAMLNWHGRHRFCSNCGAATEPSCGGLRRDCKNCGGQHFPRTDPVSIMLVARGEHCLLGRQARFVPNSYSCLAGFVSPGETIEDAVRREVLEEAGIRVGAVRYVISQPWPFPSSIMIGCFGEALSEDITIDRDELEDARWFSRDEVASMLDRRHPDGLITPPPMAIANYLMRSWVDGQAPAKSSSASMTRGPE